MAALIRESGAGSYEELWRWSVADVGRFWGAIWRRYDVLADGDPAVALADPAMPGARWFPDVALSFPEQVFRDRDRGRDRGPLRLRGWRPRGLDLGPS